MNNSSPAILKSLIAYLVCVPLAVCIGYLLTEPLDSSADRSFRLSMAGILAFILLTPVLLKWHHFLLVASWNVSMSLFFLPGSPSLWLFMVALSLGISVLYRALNSKARFISAPQITLPLLCMAAVVIFTAEMTGGIGLHSFGNEVMGGKRYILILAAILGYFALTAQRIPPQRAGFYVLVFFLGGFTIMISDLPGVIPIPSSLYVVFAVFGVSGYDYGNIAAARFAGVGNAAIFAFWLMLARYGVRGIFLSGKPWRVLIFALFTVLLFLGGFRSLIIQSILVFFIQFFLERMQQTKLLPVLVFVGIFTAVLSVPFANKLPYTFQRALAFLPLKLDPVARQDAEASSEWRLQIWKAMLPEVPGHLLLGKGLSISQYDYQTMTGGLGSISESDSGAALAGDYHNGPLSVVLPFGIWGVIAFVWFWVASIRALYDNYRYGDPSLRAVNALLLALFITRILIFLTIFGGLYGDMFRFTSIIGLSISLNGGIRRPSPTPVKEETETKILKPERPRLQPYYQP